MKTALKLSNGPVSTRRRPRASPRVVYTQPPLQLAVLVGRDGEAWRVRLGGEERVLHADASIDPKLLEEAAGAGGRVVVDCAGEAPSIAGLLVTSRAVRVDRNGEVDAKVRAFRVSADDEITVKIPRAFIRLRGEEVETYGHRILTRARGVLRLLGVAIKLN
jgi:hypothetical protein